MYRTCSEEALQLITGFLLIDLLKKERKRTFEHKDLEEEIKNGTIRKWQTRWTDNKRIVAMWTRRLIPQLYSRIRSKFRRPTYYLT